MGDIRGSTDISVISIDTSEKWETLQRQCLAFIDSGFLPDHISNNEPKVALAKALTIAIKGRELGIPPMQAFASISVIKGKPCLASELMLALCYQRVPGFKSTFTTPPDKYNIEATLVLQRRGGEPQTFVFTLDDARRAGIAVGGGAWAKYPAAMLRARVISAGCRAVAPDAIMGCYTQEEMGGAPDIDGEFDITPPEPTKPTEVVVAKSSPAPKPKIEADDGPTPKELGFDSAQAHDRAMARLTELARKAGLKNAEVQAHLDKECGKKPPRRLTWLEYNAVTKHLETLAHIKNWAPAVGSMQDIEDAARGN